MSPENGDTSAFFRPAARITEGMMLRDYARCCMDTSDGVLLTLDTLARLNRCRIVVNDAWERIVHPATLELCSLNGLPPWTALAGVHGEFELCFAVAAWRESALLRAAATLGRTPVLLGEVTEGEGVSLRTGGHVTPLDMDTLRGLSAKAASDLQSYVRELISFARQTEACASQGAATLCGEAR